MPEQTDTQPEQASTLPIDLTDFGAMAGHELRETYHAWQIGENGENPRPAKLMEAMRNHLKKFKEPLLTVVEDEAAYYSLDANGKIVAKAAVVRERGVPIQGGFPVVQAPGNRLTFTAPAKPEPNGLVLTNE